MTGENSGRCSSTHLSLHVGAGGQAHCHSYPHRPPILAVDLAGVFLRLTSADDTVTGEHLTFAHALLAAATDYLNECERLHSTAQNAAEPAEDHAA